MEYISSLKATSFKAYPCFRGLENPMGGVAGMKAAVLFGRVFDVVRDVSDGELDLDFKTSERSGEDVSLRNGTNMPVGRGDL